LKGGGGLNYMVTKKKKKRGFPARGERTVCRQGKKKGGPGNDSSTPLEKKDP